MAKEKEVKEKSKKIKTKKEDILTSKIKEFYCVKDKLYTNTKKKEDPLRFISIHIEEHPNRPGNSSRVFEHVTIHYSWFDTPEEARHFKKELLQEII